MATRAMTPWIVLLVAGISAPAELLAQGLSSDEQLLRSLDDQERVAALARDTASLDRLWSDQFTVNAPNNQVVVGKRAVLDTFVHSGIIDFSSFNRDIEFIRVDGDFAFIMGLETLEPKRDAAGVGHVAGKEIKRRFTNIWKREGSTWRLFARHANVIASPH